MTSEFLFVEKYRPQVIDDCILPDDTKKTFKEFVEKGEIPNLLLAGPPGIGKTSMIHCIAKSIGYHITEYNASDSRSISVLRGLISLGMKRLQKEVEIGRAHV